MANAPKWTDEQLSAIEARGENLLLSAAAGSGKTTVLVERVLRLVLEDGADVDRMLVVTFTMTAKHKLDKPNIVMQRTKEEEPKKR